MKKADIKKCSTDNKEILRQCRSLCKHDACCRYCMQFSGIWPSYKQKLSIKYYHNIHETRGEKRENVASKA